MKKYIYCPAVIHRNFNMGRSLITFQEHELKNLTNNSSKSRRKKTKAHKTITVLFPETFDR